MLFFETGVYRVLYLEAFQGQGHNLVSEGRDSREGVNDPFRAGARGSISEDFSNSLELRSLQFNCQPTHRLISAISYQPSPTPQKNP